MTWKNNHNKKPQQKNYNKKNLNRKQDKEDENKKIPFTSGIILNYWIEKELRMKLHYLKLTFFFNEKSI